MTALLARPADLVEIADLRERYRREAGCQIVRDSILPRGLAAPYPVAVDGDIAGYAGLLHSGEILAGTLSKSSAPTKAPLTVARPRPN